jgi:hypothetical protein
MAWHSRSRGECSTGVRRGGLSTCCVPAAHAQPRLCCVCRLPRHAPAGCCTCRIFPRSKRSEVFTIGQLRVPSRAARGSDPGAAAAGAFAKHPCTTALSGASATEAAHHHRCPPHQNISAGLLSAQLSVEQAAEVAVAAAQAAAEAAAVVPLQDNPKVATAGVPGHGLAGVLQLTLQVRRQQLAGGAVDSTPAGPACHVVERCS